MLHLHFTKLQINMTLIAKKAANTANDSLVLLCGKNTDLKKYGLSTEELTYIKKRWQEEKKHVFLNQLNRAVFVQRTDLVKEKSHQLEALRKAAASLQGVVQDLQLVSITIIDAGDRPELAMAFAEGLALSNYQFLRYRNDRSNETNKLTAIYLSGKKINAKRVDDLNIVVEATCISRDLVNEPPNTMTALQLSKEFQKLGKAAGFAVEVFNKSKIKSLKMGGLLAVNMGSQLPPTFTIMEYKPKNARNKQAVVLVGKGVVYDTGGLSLKPTPNSMDLMKSDMAGAAAVGGAMYAIAKAKLPVHVIGIVPATDNRPGENAYVPGDIITMFNGMTVEMLNADAEGRMILADALAYAKRYQPKLVIDLATLTGAAVAAIGTSGIVAMGTADEPTKRKLANSGQATYERLAEMPFWDDYDELIKSEIADMKNIGGPYAGSITAGKFLARYTDYPWMHFDIAGPSFLTARDGYRIKGGTGVGVRLLFDYFKSNY